MPLSCIFASDLCEIIFNISRCDRFTGKREGAYNFWSARTVGQWSAVGINVAVSVTRRVFPVKGSWEESLRRVRTVGYEDRKAREYSRRAANSSTLGLYGGFVTGVVSGADSREFLTEAANTSTSGFLFFDGFGAVFGIVSCVLLEQNQTPICC
ncbi:uncharacterized protein LOC126854666 [Cataglyphis hispanica]|uniref:uncharacterized protein LOC126854666 n=1 Tax=Cataglyphis hispanica TaxID=1086592 RepID=UPI00217F33FF|nr:uncharacterized protein LOC126854666 [Cataglyphis hispanica]